MGNRLKSILDLAEATENNAIRDFVEARRDWQSNQSKLLELRVFRDDYQQVQLTRAEPQSAGRFRSARTFLLQLSQAIDQQEAQVAELLNVMKSKEEKWLATKVKRKSIVRLIEKRDDLVRYEKNRQEQKELDEISQRNNHLY